MACVQVPQQHNRRSTCTALSSQQVAEFIASISPNGSRQWCPAGCTLIELFNATLFLEHGWHGKRLAAFLQEHEARFNAHVVHNATLREAHCQWLASHKVLPSGLKSEQYLALVTRACRAPSNPLMRLSVPAAATVARSPRAAAAVGPKAAAAVTTTRIMASLVVPVGERDG